MVAVLGDVEELIGRRVGWRGEGECRCDVGVVWRVGDFEEEGGGKGFGVVAGIAADDVEYYGYSVGRVGDVCVMCRQSQRSFLRALEWGNGPVISSGKMESSTSRSSTCSSRPIVECVRSQQMMR